ncbi:MAG: 50S ribosomal protein L10 [Candidatus Omnitrophica bacterium]|jgi:large subunit ribosomal protein L10|nr:50S ribosomal protein L10 [Candidatus Omnitrophota bacterium]MDD5080726.1 50S ribosomal protein L10 [Candidatus Omnitrophota bacterium]MDD5440690.1 50S ribosomal protein L10 [Candidatus Omnitrophota bacterium]
MTKTIGLITREKIVARIDSELSKSEACFFVSFGRIKTVNICNLRNDLRKVGASMFVAKNTLIRKSFESAGITDMDDLLTNETAIIFAYGKDIVEACKILVDFGADNEQLVLKGGVLNDRKITQDDLKNLAKLPGKDVLIGMAVGALAAPITGLVSRLNQVILKFVWTIEEIKKKKG